MSDLLNHSKNPDKGVNVKAKSISRKDAGFGNTPDVPVYPTYDVNMRLDNHARNSVLALAKATADKRTASEMMAILVEAYADNLEPQTEEIYQNFLKMFEEKDRLESKLKRR